MGMKKAGEFAKAPEWFRDEDGFEWAGPHTAAEQEEKCPWGFCEGDQPDCHTVQEDTYPWADFVADGTFIKVIE